MSKPTNAEMNELFSSLAPLTSSSLGSSLVPKPATPTAPKPQAPAPQTPQGSDFIATKSEYRPALRDPKTAEALAALQDLRQKHLRKNQTPGPKIVTSQFRPQPFDRYDPRVKIHPPRKPNG